MKSIKLLTPLRTNKTKTGKKYCIHENYINMFKKINVELILVVPSDKKTYQLLSTICDGLLEIGGVDINAKYYDEINHFKNQLEIPEVDQMDLDLIHLFDQLKKPIIGICRGHQIINVAFGGTLYQDIESQINTTIHHSQDDQSIYSHYINVVPGSTLDKYFDKKTMVNSYHHQVIKDLAYGFQVMAYSEDGLIEAIEKKNVLSFQWHPEKVNDENQEKILNMFLDFFIRLF